jgi:hypothetical protein
MNKIISKYISFLLLFFFIQASYSQSKLDGTWSGNIKLLGTELDVDVKFKTMTDSIKGTIDIPLQEAKDLKLIHISFIPPEVHFELPAGPGLASFDGKLQGFDIG